MCTDAFSSKSDTIEIEEKNYSSGSLLDAPVLSADSTASIMSLPALRITFPSQPSVIEEEDQSWYWTRAWQEMERKADEDVRKGNYQTFNSMDDFIASLDT